MSKHIQNTSIRPIHSVLLFALFVSTKAVPLRIVSDDVRPVQHGDEVYVKVWDKPSGGNFLGYLQECEQSSGDDPIEGHLCAEPEKKPLIISTYGDPVNAGSISFALPGNYSKGGSIVACPCDYPGTVNWYPTEGRPHSSKTSSQSDWNLAGTGNPVQYNQKYPVENIQWKQYLGWSADCSHGGSQQGKYCMKLNEGIAVGFEIIQPPSPPTCNKVSDINGTWTVIGSSNGAGMEFDYTLGITHQNNQSYTSAWSESVTVKLSLGFKFFGEDSSAEVDSKTSHSLSQSYSTIFSRTDTRKDSFTFDKPGVVWQFQMNVNDDCGNSLMQSKDLRLTQNRVTPPCCLPGFEKDITQPSGDCVPDSDGKMYNLCKH